MIIFTEFSALFFIVEQTIIHLAEHAKCHKFHLATKCHFLLLYNKGSSELLLPLCVRHCHHHLTAVSSKNFWYK